MFLPITFHNFENCSLGPGLVLCYVMHAICSVWMHASSFFVTESGKVCVLRKEEVGLKERQVLYTGICHYWCTVLRYLDAGDAAVGVWVAAMSIRSIFVILMSLDGKDSVRNFEKRGQEQYTSFVTDIIIERQKLFPDPITKNSFQLSNRKLE